MGVACPPLQWPNGCAPISSAICMPSPVLYLVPRTLARSSRYRGIGHATRDWPRNHRYPEPSPCSESRQILQGSALPRRLLDRSHCPASALHRLQPHPTFVHRHSSAPPPHHAPPPRPRPPHTP